MIDSPVEQREEAAPAVGISGAEGRFEHGRKIAGAVAAPLTLALLAASTGRLRYQGRMLAGVLGAVAVLWMTEALPLPVTALLGAALCVLLGVADARAVLAPFADPIVFLFLGSFMLARAMAVHGLDRRIALAFLSRSWVGAHPARLLAGLGLVTGFVSMWVSNTAAAAMIRLPPPTGRGGHLLLPVDGAGGPDHRGTDRGAVRCDPAAPPGGLRRPLGRRTIAPPPAAAGGTRSVDGGPAQRDRRSGRRVRPVAPARRADRRDAGRSLGPAAGR